MRQRSQNMRSGPTQSQRLQVPLLYAFREAAAAGDARKANLRHAADGARILSQRASLRQRGANEVALKRNLNIDLDHLVNTINLASVVELDAYPAVRRSVLNFGIDDLAHLTVASSDINTLGASLRAALIAHEPRLVPDTLRVERRDADQDSAHRIGFHTHAEMKCRPVDIPLEFVAEIDVGSGKVELHGVAGSAAGPRPAPSGDGDRAGTAAKG